MGFRHFVGVDGSEGMLRKAEKTGLYQDLKLVLLGPQPLPVQTGVTHTHLPHIHKYSPVLLVLTEGISLLVPDVFDVVTIVGALDAGFVPVSAVRELCRAAKPGDFSI